MGKKISEKEILEYAKSVKEYKFMKLVSYKGVSSILEFYCEKHNYTFQITYRNMAKRGNGCPKCSQDKRSNSRTKWTEDSIMKYIKENTKLKLIKINKFNGRNSIITTLCEHGHECEVRFESVLYSNECKECNIRKDKKGVWTDNEIKKRVESEGYELIEILEDKRIVVKCDCGHEPYETNFYNFNAGYKCKKCASEKLSNEKKYNIKYISNELNKINYKLISKEYINSWTPIKICCDKGHLFEMSWNCIQRGQRCPYCNKTNGEIEISRILNNNNIRYVFQYKFEDCINKKSLPFDFYLPDYNVCIEYDGEYHYRAIRGIEKLDYQQHNDNIKTQYCERNNIKLIRIPYWEFKNIENILKIELNIK